MTNITSFELKLF